LLGNPISETKRLLICIQFGNCAFVLIRCVEISVGGH